MVSFSCAGCGDVLTKKKLNGHVNQCWGAAFTCIDCMTDFQGNAYMSHTSCMSEAQKYQGHLYRPEKEKKGNNRQNQQQQAAQQQNNKQNQQQGYNHGQSKALAPYVEEEIENRVALVETMPEAPTPPSAVPDFEPSTESKPNVFDFYAGQATPNASTTDLTKFSTTATAVVKFSDAAETPAKKAKKEKAPKSDKKRKRLHVDTSGGSSVDRDLEMPDVETDGPPGLHTGLTGGLKQLMPREGFFPPTPELSGDAETPVKAKKAKKVKKEMHLGLMARMGSGLINSAVGRRTSGGSSTGNKEDGPSRKKTKAIEYKPSAVEEGSAAVIPFEPKLEPEAMAAQLMAFVPAAEESEKGVSMDKALKRYHRMRKEAGDAQGKREEEECLWKALRMKRNEAGEIVLFFTTA